MFMHLNMAVSFYKPTVPGNSGEQCGMGRKMS